VPEVDVGAAVVVVAFVLAVDVDCVCETGGALEAVTVFVDEPHAASTAVAHTAAAVESATRGYPRID
jgi:hypothetical protein